MQIKKIKDYIITNKKIEYILQEIGCQHICYHRDGNPDNYYTCANSKHKDGKNPSAITVYENDSLYCVNYTRTMNDKEHNDLIDLVMFNKDMENIFEAIKYLCDILNLDYYSLQNEDDLPESIKLTKMLLDMESGEFEEEEKRLEPISEKILTYYKPYCNLMFYNDNIDFDIQKIFEIGYDDYSNCITIPIRDEIGNLVGVKGRFLDETLTSNKYVYLERCGKSKILYGLNLSFSYIKNKGKVFVGESEKFVMQLFNMGYFNAVSTGGSKISKYQINKLASLGVEIVLCYDKDISEDELKKIADRFPYGVKVSAIIDKDDILDTKQSPSDDRFQWSVMVDKYIFQLSE